MRWHIFADFDGTITLDDTTDAILRQFASDEWEKVEARWLTGLIGSRQCLVEQVALIQAEEAVIDRFASQFTIDPYFPKFVDACARFDLPLTIVSDGFDRIVRSTLNRYGLGTLPIKANCLHHRGGGRWALDFPNGQSSCRSLSGTCKCAVSRFASAGLGDDRDLRLLIGDGRSDHCLADDADFVFAKAGLKKYCRLRNIPHRPFHSFAEVCGLLSLLLDEAPVTADPAGPWRRQEMTNA
jgi:2,3-diketo-5-methylthio-1-phosphopentane phosphatase